MADILSALFSILAFRVYLNALNLLKVRKNTSTFQAVYIKRTLWSITIVLLIGLALLFKEQGITYLVKLSKVDLLHITVLFYAGSFHNTEFESRDFSHSCL